MSASTVSLMSLIEDSPTVAVDHDIHAAQLDLIDKIQEDHDGIMPVVHVTEPTSPVPPSTSPELEPALLLRPSTANSLLEETYQQRRARYRSAVEVRQILFFTFYSTSITSIRRVPPVGSQASLLTLSIVETHQ